MKSIWKYPLNIIDTQSVEIPANSRILSVQFQHEVLTVWAHVEASNPKVLRKIHIYGTGHPADSAEYLDFIGTAQQYGLVWHVFAERDK